MKTVIMAGGKGTRISSLFPDIPKVLIPINGKPVLEWEIESLRSQGFNDIVITVSHMADQIMDYFGDSVEYFVEEQPMGNAGALQYLDLQEDFLLLNADSIFDVDFQKFVKYHREKGGKTTLFAHPNSHPYDSGLLICDDNNRVKSWLTKEDARPTWYNNRVNAGLHILSPELIIHDETPGKKIDLDRDILKPSLGKCEIYAYDSPEYIKDMGTPERYAQVSRDFTEGRTRKKKAVFLDRDGTINKYFGFVRDIDNFELNEGAAEAIKAINNSDYLAIVVTNQPVIARGEVSWDELNEMHRKMETLLGQQGAYLDGIYVCPHHPDKGFEGERPEYKIVCDCRKPKPGMLLKAADDFGIDLSQSYMIGDDDRDVQAGEAAGCKTIKIEQDGNLIEAVRSIL